MINDNYTYVGKTTNCYSKAVLSSFIDTYSTKCLYDFEISSTVPFGIIYRREDPNRLLDCYLDPDIGIDRALNILEIPFDLKYWLRDTGEEEALSILKEWSRETPVVLGPLNMDKLSYHFQNNVFRNMDHYIVVIKNYDQSYHICDPEGMPIVAIKEKDLLLAWKASDILEGRGSFTIRRVKTYKSEIEIQKEQLINIFRLSIENLEKAADKENGGSHALKLIARDAKDIEKSPSLIRGLSYAIPTRIQRCVFSNYLLYNLVKKIELHHILKDITNVHKLFNCQIDLYSSILRRLSVDPVNSIKTFDRMADYENDITRLLSMVNRNV